MISRGDSSGKTTRFYLVITSLSFVLSTYLPLFYVDLGVIYNYVITFLNVSLIIYVYKFCMDLNDDNISSIM